MPDTADHRANVYMLARSRVKAGKPSWAGKVDVSDVFHNDDLPFIEKRDAIVARIKASRWYKNADPHTFDGLHDIVDNLATEGTPDEFDYWWDQIYDIADVDRIWINT